MLATYLFVFLWWLRAIFLSCMVSSRADANDCRSATDEGVAAIPPDLPSARSCSTNQQIKDNSHHHHHNHTVQCHNKSTFIMHHKCNN